MKKHTQKACSILSKVTVITVLMLFVFACPLVSLHTYADETYLTPTFNVDIKASENNSFAVKETIDVDFLYPHHGIYRYIPKNGVHISDIDVPGYRCDVSSRDGHKMLKIGNPETLLTGPQTYEVNYKLAFYDDEDKSLDRLALNVLPTGWETQIDHASATITLPKEADLSKVQIYSGEYGDAGNPDNVKLTTSDDGKTITLDAYDLPAYHGVTVILELPEGYWTGEPEYGAISPLFWIMFLLGPLGALIMWFLYGRDPHIVKTLEFYPPDDLTPGEIGYLYDKNVDKRDIVSTIVYLADKGYISIEQESRKDFLLKGRKKPSSGEPEYVRTIYDGLFADRNKGLVRTSSLGSYFSWRYQNAKAEIPDELYFGPFVTKSSRIARGIGIVASAMPLIAFSIWEIKNGSSDGVIGLLWGTVLIMLATAILCRAVDNARSQNKIKTALWFCLGMLLVLLGLTPSLAISDMLESVSDTKAIILIMLVIVGTGATMLLAIISTARPQKYTEIMGRILGFRDFIKTAELDKINELIEKDPEYFYHIIPYAYVFGLTNRWIEKFEDIDIVRPEWIKAGGDYSIDHFDAYMMGRMMSDCNASISSNIKAPHSSGTIVSSGGSSG
ncbi:MAG: DUF2207 domain-containing protein, partial [Mogibacterium sp.]|nr:DUF2207 domain-containing protein [Mogibacterium sp.]